MKKLLTALILACAIAVGFIYLFIPNRIVASKVSFTHCMPSAVYRILCWEEKWKSWFPSDKIGKNAFILNGDTLHIGKQNPSPFAVQIVFNPQNGTETKSLIKILNFPNDSAAIEWECEYPKEWNPIKRVMLYFQARRMKRNMQTIMDRLTSFVEKKENVYGVDIKISSTKDTLLISTQSSFKDYPNTLEVYGLIGKLRQYISKTGSVETGYPMLNVKQDDSINFVATVAVPVNRLLVNNAQLAKEGFSIKRMIPGHFLTAQFTGGPATIKEVFRQMGFYFQDYSKVAIAIPFESMITERINEPDTSKWVTKIYAPVF